MTAYQNPYAIDYSQRDPLDGVNSLFPQRWSPRSFQKIDIPAETLTTIFDAARWTHSCFNAQPWVFLTSSGADDFDRFLNLLAPKNQEWAKNASVIGFILAKKLFDHNGNPNPYAVFDCGTAWMALTMQARMFGLYTHGMAGIKKKAVYQEFQISDEQYEVICGFVIGVLDTPDKLSEDVAAREKPSPRNSVETIWKQGELS